MGKVILGMTMSLDGFVNDLSGSVQSLYPDLTALRNTTMLQEAIRTTGAVIMGRHAYAMGNPDWYVDNYEFQVPIFVLTHHVPETLPKQNDKLTFTFVVDGSQSAIEQAKAAAGNKNVTVIGGAHTAQQLIKAGFIDEIQVGIMPVFLGEGLRLFENLGTDAIRLEKLAVIESSARTDLRFRVAK